MSTIVNCKLNGKELRVSNNFVQIEDSFLQLELVKKFIDCRAKTPIGKSPLPMFFNKYLRKYKLTEIVFREERTKYFSESEFENNYIDQMIEESVGGMAA